MRCDGALIKITLGMVDSGLDWIEMNWFGSFRLVLTDLVGEE